ncbi:MAG: hypothetical protein HY332_24900 [Chloroflexi bacterium]|nr:hypothetical protein [Chloroflexota bacterium]
MSSLREWVAERSKEDDLLYKRYGRPLEPEHRGEYVAISKDGQVILGKDELKIAREAAERFGPGTFALRRIGYDAEIRWRRSA